MLSCLLKRALDQLGLHPSPKSRCSFLSIKICNFCRKLPFTYSFLWIEPTAQTEPKDNSDRITEFTCMTRYSDGLGLDISTPPLQTEKSALRTSSSAETMKALRVGSLKSRVQWVSGRKGGRNRQRMDAPVHQDQLLCGVGAAILCRPPIRAQGRDTPPPSPCILAIVPLTERRTKRMEKGCLGNAKGTEVPGFGRDTACATELLWLCPTRKGKKKHLLLSRMSREKNHNL